ncbi:hypothetical protein [Aquisalibacillus elongatus]|uniref:Uncharacterized protein n=1 Tax=Aquisalibacillus elongatus TaxID=485577 RepID=A0A3N5BDJ4_9BACI|nr:hypothetical protein [Aquisalibacillus elongatus]RPF55497.1 hypothetical protein EDC24_0375 [Aquisalibacillus elongatus]
MKNNKILIGMIFVLILSNIFFAYRSFELNKQLEQSNQITNSTVWHEFTDLIGSLHYVSQELAQYDASMNEDEKELYLYSLGKEANRLNEIGKNLNRIFIRRGQDEYLKYEEHIWIIEEFIGDVSRDEVKDEKRIHNLAKVINEQQKYLSEMFYSDNAIALSGANEDENIKRIEEILEVIIEEINKNYGVLFLDPLIVKTV